MLISSSFNLPTDISDLGNNVTNVWTLDERLEFKNLHDLDKCKIEYSRDAQSLVSPVGIQTLIRQGLGNLWKALDWLTVKKDDGSVYLFGTHINSWIFDIWFIHKEGQPFPEIILMDLWNNSLKGDDRLNTTFVQLLCERVSQLRAISDQIEALELPNVSVINILDRNASAEYLVALEQASAPESQQVGLILENTLTTHIELKSSIQIGNIS